MELKKHGEVVKEFQGLRKDAFSLSPDIGNTRIRWAITKKGLETASAGTHLVVQWLRLHAPNAGGPGSVPSQGTRLLMLQLRAHMLRLKILHAAAKMPSAQCSQFF